MIVMAPISVGELVDKITILEIKLENLSDNAKKINVKRELDELNAILSGLVLPDISDLTMQLSFINLSLWRIEDGKRACEKEQMFGEHFVHLARQVYLKNDERARIKREINFLCGSTIVEEKSYANV